jgi:hypothetical protein
MPTRLKLIASPQRSVIVSTLSLGLAVAALACTDQGVDLGGGTLVQDLARGSRCTDSTVVDDNVLVTDQAELAALEGCEEIRGQLAVQVFANADLTPLHALRIVDGALYLGASATDPLVSPDQFSDTESLEAIQEREAPLFADGWLASFAGLESLEHIGALVLISISSSDLRGFEHLESLGGDIASRALPLGFPSGKLLVENSPKLRDFAGFERVQGFDNVDLFGNPSLESLSGLSFDPTLTVLSVANSPALTNIDALAPLQFVNTLYLDGVGLTDLQALSGLQGFGDGLFIQDNPALVDASALEGLQQGASILFDNNRALKRLPRFRNFFSLPKGLIVRDNPALEELSIDFAAATPQSFPVGNDYREFGADWIEVGNNAALSTFSVTPSIADGFGLVAAQVASIHDNPSLTRIDLGSLQRIGLLSITGNPELAEVELGALQSIESLEVRDNPQLSTAVFADTSTFERQLSGNAD